MLLLLAFLVVLLFAGLGFAPPFPLDRGRSSFGSLARRLRRRTGRRSGEWSLLSVVNGSPLQGR